MLVILLGADRSIQRGDNEIQYIIEFSVPIEMAQFLKLNNSTALPQMK